MISIERQQRLLLNLSKELQKPVTVYAVGGTAMMFLGLKESTLDIDLVFNDKEGKELFMGAAQALGYRLMDAFKMYGVKNNVPDMLTLGDERFDLFVVDVVDFTFSESMRERAVDTHQFGDMLVLKIASPQDLILMKCATDRVKDKDDARTIILNTTVKWDVLIEEAKTQVKLGRTEAIFHLGGFLEDLRNSLGDKVPEEVVHILYNLVEEQIKERTKKLHNK